MKINRQITAVSRRARTACFGLRKGCDTIFPAGVTLTVWRAGCWPQKEWVEVTPAVNDGCSCTPAVYEERDVWTARVLYTGMDVDAQGRVCFVFDELLFAQGAGRYDADLSACGKTVRVHLHVQDGLEVRDSMTVADIGCNTGCLVDACGLPVACATIPANATTLPAS
jgi:hypothetical protein